MRGRGGGKEFRFAKYLKWKDPVLRPWPLIGRENLGENPRVPYVPACTKSIGDAEGIELLRTVGDWHWSCKMP